MKCILLILGSIILLIVGLLTWVLLFPDDVIQYGPKQDAPDPEVKDDKHNKSH
jgi:hypothetical protein